MGQTENHILSARARQYEWAGVGGLSLKTFHGGHALYRTPYGHHRVDESNYLVLNDQQPYHILIDSPTPVESLCVFFDPAFVADIYHSLTRSDAALLDDPAPQAAALPSFYEHTHPRDELLTPALVALRDAKWRRASEPRLDLGLRQLFEALLHLHHRDRLSADQLQARRAATRAELYRRLHLARDFILANLGQPIALDDMARTACLSPNHFLRTFKQLFHQSPHQFLTEHRLAQAKRDLLQSDRSITEIGLSLGFESLGAFSGLFNRATGQSPQAFRATRRHQSRAAFRKKGDFREAPAALSE